jgi:large subunit ribosomal protein L24
MAFRIRKGDTVQVISGNSKGKVGRVLSVDETKMRVVVERVNFVKRHTKARSAAMKSGIIEKEAPLHVSKVMLYDSKAGKGVRVGVRTLPDGTRERVSKASGEVISKGE